MFDPHFLFFSHKDVSPLYGIMIDMIPGITIDVIQDLIAGHGSKSDLQKSRMSVMGSHEPGGTSVKNIKHLEKLVREKDFVDY